MKIKFLFLALCGLLVYGCTKTVEAPFDENEVTNLSTARKSVVFKFTAQSCGACGAWVPYYEGFCDSNYQKVIGVHVHNSADTFGTSMSGWFTSHFDIPGTPRFAGGYDMTLDTTWWDVVRPRTLAILDEPADIGIGIAKSISGNVMTIRAKTQCFKNLPAGNYNIAMYIMENDCWGYQAGTPGPVDSIYHMKILRGSANGLWGTPLTDVSKGDPVDHTFTYSLGTPGQHYWNPEKLEVLAIIYKVDANGDPIEVMNCNTTSKHF